MESRGIYKSPDNSPYASPELFGSSRSSPAEMSIESIFHPGKKRATPDRCISDRSANPLSCNTATYLLDSACPEFMSAPAFNPEELLAPPHLAFEKSLASSTTSPERLSSTEKALRQKVNDLQQQLDELTKKYAQQSGELGKLRAKMSLYCPEDIDQQTQTSLFPESNPSITSPGADTLYYPSRNEKDDTVEKMIVECSPRAQEESDSSDDELFTKNKRPRLFRIDSSESFTCASHDSDSSLYQHLASDFWDAGSWPELRSFPFEHSDIFGSLSEEDKKIALDIKSAYGNKNPITRAGNIHFPLVSLAKRYNEEQIPLPSWKEIVPQNEWNHYLLEYAGFRLQIRSIGFVRCHCLKLIRKNVSAYFYVLGQYFLAKGSTCFTYLVNKLKKEGIPVPEVKIFSSKADTWHSAHVNFFLWYLAPGSYQFSAKELRNIIPILNSQSPEYSLITAEYFLNIMTESSIELPFRTDSTHVLRKLVDSTSNLKSKGVAIPAFIMADNPKSTWNADLAIKLLEKEKPESCTVITKTKQGLFLRMSEAVINKDIESYKKSLQKIINKDFAAPPNGKPTINRTVWAIRNGYPNVQMWGIEGTTVGQPPLTVPKFLFSCLYHLGFNAFILPQLKSRVTSMAELITCCETDPALKNIAEKLLTIRFSSCQRASLSYFCTNVRQTPTGLPELARMNQEDLLTLCSKLPEITWSDGSKTTPCDLDLPEPGVQEEGYVQRPVQLPLPSGEIPCGLPKQRKRKRRQP